MKKETILTHIATHFQATQTHAQPNACKRVAALPTRPYISDKFVLIENTIPYPLQKI